MICMKYGFYIYIIHFVWIFKDQKMHQSKHCEYNNKDEDNSLNTLIDNTCLSLSIFTYVCIQGIMCTQIHI